MTARIRALALIRIAKNGAQTLFLPLRITAIAAKVPDLLD